MGNAKPSASATALNEALGAPVAVPPLVKPDAPPPLAARSPFRERDFAGTREGGHEAPLVPQAPVSSEAAPVQAEATPPAPAPATAAAPTVVAAPAARPATRNARPPRAKTRFPKGMILTAIQCRVPGTVKMALKALQYGPEQSGNQEDQVCVAIDDYLASYGKPRLCGTQPRERKK